MLISLKVNQPKPGWSNRYIQIEDEQQLFYLIYNTVRRAGFFEFCTRREVEMAKKILHLFPVGIREEVIKAIDVYETMEGFWS